MNGAKCTNDEFDAFNCTCLGGFSGIYCEIEPGMDVQYCQGFSDTYCEIESGMVLWSRQLNNYALKKTFRNVANA